MAIPSRPHDVEIARLIATVGLMQERNGAGKSATYPPHFSVKVLIWLSVNGEFFSMVKECNLSIILSFSINQILHIYDEM